MDNSSYSALLVPACSFLTKLTMVILVLLPYQLPPSISRWEINSHGFNAILQSAVNSVVWPETYGGMLLLGALFVNRLAGLSVFKWSGTLDVQHARAQLNLSDTDGGGMLLQWLIGHMLSCGESDILDPTAAQQTKHSHADVQSAAFGDLDGNGLSLASDVQQLISVSYQVFKALAPLLPIAVGYTQFTQQERQGHVSVSDLHLPKGMYRSFMLILVVESACSIASVPLHHWHYVMELPFLSLVTRYYWDWSLVVMILIWLCHRVVFSVTGCVFLVTVVPLVGVNYAHTRMYGRLGRLLRTVCYVILSTITLLALHRLAFVALAKLTAIRAHQFAYALKKVAHSVATQYRYGPTAQTEPASPAAEKCHAKAAPRADHPKPAGNRIQLLFSSQSVHDFGALRPAPIRTDLPSLVSPSHNRLVPSLHARRFSNPAGPLDHGHQRGWPSLQSPLLVSSRPQPAHAHKHHTKDISAAVVALSKGIIPCTPLERLEQYKMASAGERRLRKVSMLVWVVLLANASILAAADSYLASEPPASSNYSRAPVDLGSISVVLSHSVHFLHIGYMWAFVQRKIQRAEQGIIDAWEEVKLLHSRLPSSTICKEEAEDWLQFLRSRRDRTYPTWPARVISALGILRFVLPALLTVDPTSSVRDNVMDALRALAVGGKYVIFRSKQ